MYVYLLRSVSHPTERYVGLTANLKARMAEHNSGRSTYTSKFSPWKLVTAIYFDDPEKARAFERYLKQGSGHAFASKHLW